MTKHINHVGDRLTPIAATLKQKTGDCEYAAKDLTGATVAFRMEDENGVRIVDDAPATISDAEAGEVYYAPTDSDVSVPGVYHCWWIVTSGGLSDTYPAEGDEYQEWEIL